MNNNKVKFVFICTPSPFREYILHAARKKEDVIIYESEKNFKVNYDTSIIEEESINYTNFRYTEKIENSYHVENINDSHLINLINSINSKKYVILSGANFIKNDQLKNIKNSPGFQGIYNIHFGNCLKYRGLDSNIWASYHEDFKNIGVSLHNVSSELDKGDLVIYSMITNFNSIEDLKFKEIESAKNVLAKFRSIIDSNSIIPNIKNKGLGRYYGPMPACLKKIALKKIFKKNLL